MILKRDSSQKSIAIKKLNIDNIDNFNNVKNGEYIFKKSNKGIKKENTESKKPISDEKKEASLKVNKWSKTKR